MRLRPWASSPIRYSMAENFKPILVVPPGNVLNTPWVEFISNTGSTADGHWSNDNSQQSMVIDINWDDRRAAVGQILGYSVRVGNSLERHIPWRHPYFEWLYATQITSMRGVDWQERFATPFGAVSRYGLERLSVTFSTLPFDVIEDAVGVEEWNRFVIKSSKPTSELAASDRGAFKFAAGPSAGLPFKGAIATSIARTTLAWKWMYVPDNYIFNANGVGVNIEAGLGRINGAAFSGRPAGTLLFETVEYEPVMAPVSPQTLGYQAWQPPRLWNVTFYFKFFDPPFDPALPNKRGFLIYPDIASPDGYWYEALSDPGGAPPYKNYNFPDLFKAV